MFCCVCSLLLFSFCAVLGLTVLCSWVCDFGDSGLDWLFVVGIRQNFGGVWCFVILI